MADEIPGLGHLLVGQPEIGERLQRALALKGALPQYTEDEYGLSVTVEDLSGVEFLWLRRAVRLSQGINLPAVAAQFSQCAFAPIAGPAGVLAVVEKLIIANFSGTNLQYLVDSQPNTAVVTAPGVPKSGLDDRSIPFNQLQPTPAFGLVGATAAAALTGLGAMRIAVPLGSTIQLDLNWIFTGRVVLSTPAPSLLMVQGFAVNAPLDVTVVWRERALLTTER